MTFCTDFCTLEHMKTYNLTQARGLLSSIVAGARDQYARTLITTFGRPAAVIISPEEYDSWQETLEIMADDATMKSIARAAAEAKEDKLLSHEDIFS